MTFREVLDTLLNYCGQASGGEFEDFLKVLVNEKYQEVLDLGGVPHEQRVFTLTTVAATSKYGLPLYVRRVLNVEDPTTPRFVYETTARFFDRNYPGNTSSGTPSLAFPIGTRGVQRLPAAAGTLSLVSSSAVDTGANYKVRVQGFNSAGVLSTELVTMAGTTPATTTTSFSATLGVERVVKAPATGMAFNGNVTVSDSSGNALAIIPLWWNSPDYNWLEFYPIPDAAISYNVRCEMRKPPLVYDSDWPEFDANYHMLLVFGVTKDLLPNLGKATAGDRHRTSYAELEKRFLRANNTSSSGLWTFADVQAGTGVRNRPQRPLIRGVDFGLVP